MDGREILGVGPELTGQQESARQRSFTSKNSAALTTSDFNRISPLDVPTDAIQTDEADGNLMSRPSCSASVPLPAAWHALTPSQSSPPLMPTQPCSNDDCSVSAKRDTIQFLYEAHHDDIFRFARWTLGDERKSYDVVQEVFTRAIQGFESFRRDSNPKTWLLSIARNYIYDTLRRQKRWKAFIERYHPPSPEDGVGQAESHLDLELALAGLKDSYREVFVLRHVEELTVSETAKVLGWSEGKVRTTDYRAMAKLRANLRISEEE